MVANIRDVLARHPEARMLASVGASHEGYYETYLNQMHDIRLHQFGCRTIGLSKIRGAISKLAIALDDIRTSKEDPNSTKRF